jgi:hypothetical protein
MGGGGERIYYVQSVTREKSQQNDTIVAAILGDAARDVNVAEEHAVKTRGEVEA